MKAITIIQVIKMIIESKKIAFKKVKKGVDNMHLIFHQKKK